MSQGPHDRIVLSEQQIEIVTGKHSEAVPTTRSPTMRFTRFEEELDWLEIAGAGTGTEELVLASLLYRGTETGIV